MIVRAAGIACAAVIAAACTDATTDRPAGNPSDRAAHAPDIVLLTVDTLRADRLGAAGYAPRGGSPTPLADRLAADGAILTRCYAPRGQTHPSLASMLTGKFPITHGLRDNGMQFSAEHVPFPVTLKRAGYRTAAFCSNLDRTRWPFWIRGFDAAEDGVEGALLEEGARGFEMHAEWDERTVAKALAWIGTLPPRDGEPSAPFFLWVHLYDAHQPYTPSEDARARFMDPAYDGPFRHPRGSDDAPRDAVGEYVDAWALSDATFGAADLAAVDALYDAGVWDTDRRLQRVVDALTRRGLFDEALVVYSSDHGEELGRHHDYFGHGNSIYDDVLHIPLVVRWPGEVRPGTRIDGLCQNLDLFPTFLEAAGIEVPSDTEGISLLPHLLGERADGPREFAFGEWEDLLYSISDGAWKAIANPRGVQPRKPPYRHREGAAFPYECAELYHLSADPGEQVNLHASRPDEARRLGVALRAFLSHPSHRTPLALPDRADPALEALGYIGSTRNKRDVLTIECGEDR